MAIRAGVDGRLGPAKFPGLEEGDGHVIRHAAQPASAPALRSLIISRGMPTFSNPVGGFIDDVRTGRLQRVE